MITCASSVSSSGLLQPPAADGGSEQLEGRGPHVGRSVGAGAAHHAQLEGALREGGGHEVQLLLPHALRRRLPLLPPTGMYFEVST